MNDPFKNVFKTPKKLCENLFDLNHFITAKSRIENFSKTTAALTELSYFKKMFK